ncbi:WD-40 repeat-containing [Brachionus plicatilis]|uniref:WD-40 repeat-containing n=1 Tax=Brachionus plicatilis TaxID=10195 RepID=A0A3M7SJF7_BRAPC|nr:WD-40 repeat-containing [Brachionus plicatilis]
MFKSFIFCAFLVIWTITEVKSESSRKDLIDGFRKDNSRYWLISCTLSGCSFAFSSCMNCYGERGCKSCISLSKPECSVCADDIYNKDDLETIDGNEYLICDPGDPIQSKVCHLYCRGQYAQSGQCVRVNNLPICKCSSESESTSSPNIPSINFNGTVKLNIPISGYYQRILPLPNGDLVRGSRRNLIEIWDLQKGIIKRNLTSVYSWPWVFGLLSNVWDLKITNGDPLKRIIQTNDSFVCLTVLKNDDLAIVQYRNSYDIIIRDSQNGLIKNKLVGHLSTVYQIIELSNGNLVSYSNDKTIKIWNISNSSVIKSITHVMSVRSIAFLPNGNLVSGLADGTINIWNLETNQLIKNLIGHKDGVCVYTCLHVLANGNILSGSWDKSIKVWNPNNGTAKFTSSFHKSSAYQLAVLPSGNIISSSGSELIVCLI